MFYRFVFRNTITGETREAIGPAMDSGGLEPPAFPSAATIKRAAIRFERPGRLGSAGTRRANAFGIWRRLAAASGPAPLTKYTIDI